MKVISSIAILIAWVFSCEDKKRDVGPPVMPDRALSAAIIADAGVNSVEVRMLTDIFKATHDQSVPGINSFILTRSIEPDLPDELQNIPRYSFEADSIPHIDILLVPGSNPDRIADAQLIQFIQTAGRKALYVIGLSEGVGVLAQAGLLETYHCTTAPTFNPVLKARYPHLSIHEEVSFVFHTRMITSRGGRDTIDPALYLVTLLYGKGVAEEIAKAARLDWDLHAAKYLQIQ